MIILKQLFHKTAAPDAVQQFWSWFVRHESRYRLKQWSPAEFLEAAIGQLRSFDPWLKLLVSSDNGGELELIVTADGDIALFTRVHELVRAAPQVPGWRFTPLKQPMGMEQVRIEMNGEEFSRATLHFYAEESDRFPDEVALVLTHKAYRTADDELFQSGGMIYLENALGELNAATRIDRYRVGPEPADRSKLIALGKLPDYLLWREKEAGTRRGKSAPDVPRPPDRWRIIEAEDRTGRPMLAAFNRAYHDWPHKPCFPWLVAIHIQYKGRRDGLPDERQWAGLQQMEDEILALLPQTEVILLGHKTYDHLRVIYLYAIDYWNSSVALNDYRQQSGWPYDLAFYMTLDKYWQAASGFF